MPSRRVALWAVALAAVTGCGDTNIYLPEPEPGAPPSNGPNDPDPSPSPSPSPNPGPQPGPTPSPPPAPTPEPGDPLAPDFVGRQGDFDEMGERAADLDPTAASAMPTTGAATYKGSAELTLGTGAGMAVLYGEARIRADFEDGIVSGDLDDFVGAVGSGAIAEWDGKIEIEEIEGDPGSPDMGGLASGQLEAGGTVLTVDATLDGGFLGADASTIGLGASDGSGSIDGRRVGATLDIWAEQVWRGQ